MKPSQAYQIILLGEQRHVAVNNFVCTTYAQTYEFRNPVSETTEPIDRPPLQNELPEPTGDNKYTKNMVPGYTGQIYSSNYNDSICFRLVRGGGAEGGFGG